MNNDEIRYKILRTLYDEYYEGSLFDSRPTTEIIKKSKLDSENPNLVNANVDYLSNSHYVEGLRDLSQPYPTSIRLVALGIDFVEFRESELQNYHNKIRFRILSMLYELHFGGFLGQNIDTDEKFIQNLTLTGIDNNVIYGDLIYLEKKGYINGEYAFGKAYPVEVSIDTYGIDTVENIVNQSVEDLSKADIDPQSKIEVDAIRKEDDKTSKIRRFGEFISKHESSVTKIIIEIIKAVVNSGMSGA